MSETEDRMPEGYTWEESSSAFINHIGRVYMRKTEEPDGSKFSWAALRIEKHHVNTWNFGHGSMMAAMAEIGTSSPVGITADAPAVIVDLSLQFIGAPKLDELLEVKGWVTKRTRSLVFAQASATSDGKLVFTASAIHKVIGA